jgi:putative ABC transport system permease protein
MFSNPAKMVALIRMSLRSLMLHKLRSLLTILGLVVGVASVVIMLAVAEGAGQEAQRNIEALGIRNVIVRSVKPSGGEQEKERNGVYSYGLTYLDMRRLNETLSMVDRIAPLREFRYEARYLDRSLEARLVGIEPDYQEANNLEMMIGRFIDSNDSNNQANVCVLGAEVAEKLFVYDSPIGKTVQIANKQMFRVVGVTKEKLSSAGIGSSLSAQDYNRDVYIPLSTDRNRMGELLVYQQQGTESYERLELSQLTLQVTETNLVKAAASAVESLLGSTHSKKDFEVTIPLDLLEQVKAQQRIFNFILGSIAAISLLVGGIGIMNIMLATVSERTGEIGIRRALGATKGDITMQFLVETTVLATSGAFLGALVGIVVPPLLSFFTGRETALTWWGPMIAVLVAMSTGLIFGIYPARRAAMLDPIEALRRL